MKVKDLINLLYKQNPEHVIYIKGYEGGACEMDTIATVQVALNYNLNDDNDQVWYYGPHELTVINGQEQPGDYANHTVVPGVYLDAKHNDDI